MLVPQDVESVKERLCTPEQEITELRFPISIEANDLAVETAVPTFQVASRAFTMCGLSVERVPIARNEPNAVVIGVQHRSEAVAFDLEEPVWVRRMAHERG